MPQTTIQLECQTTPYSILVEPWASPAFEITPDERCAIVVEHPTIEPIVTCAVVDGGLHLTVYTSGSTFKFVRAGIVDFEMRVPIPRLSGEV